MVECVFIKISRIESSPVFGISASFAIQGCNFIETLEHHRRPRLFAQNILFEIELVAKSSLHCRLATLLK